MAAGEWVRKEPLCICVSLQYTSSSGASINMRAVTFSFVDQSSSRGLKKFGEKILTSPISPEVIDVHTLNFKPNFKFSRLNFFFWGGTPSQLGCALGSRGQSLAHVKISGYSPSKGENTVSRKVRTTVGQ